MVEFMPPVRLLSAKFKRPGVPNTYLPRPSLLEHLNRHRGQPLILVSAPAGFGKTTLLSAWVESSDWPCAWLSLDASDDNLYAFVEHLLGALQVVFPDTGQDTLLMLRTAPVLPKQVLADSLISALDNLDTPFILVLDDYHVIHDPAVHDLLIEVLRYPPRCLHVVLATRYDPPLPVTSLVAKDKLTEIRANDLRFSADDARALVHRVAGQEVDDAMVGLIRDKAEGWAAILHLAALSLRQKPSWVRDPRILIEDSYRVTDYLITEVLAQQPPAVHEFLLKTSILDQLSNSLCEAVAGVGIAVELETELDAGQTILERLIQMGLLSSPVDDTHEWYRHHPVFQELLQDQLRRSSSARSIAGLHRRASTWFAQNGMGAEALRHALAANDVLAAVRIVCQYRHELMNGEQWGRLDGWVRLLSRDVVDAHAELLLCDAWDANSRQRQTELSALLDQAESVLAGATPTLEPADALQGEVAALRSAQHYYAGDTARSMACASLALKLIPHHWSYPRLFSRLFLALGHLAKGETTTAFEVACSSLTEMKGQGDAGKGLVFTTLGLLYWIAADLKALNQVASQLLAIAQTLGQPQSKGFGHYLLGIVHYQRNELTAAEQELSAAVSESYSITMACFIHSAFALSLTHQALSRPGEARGVADSILPFLLEMRCPDLVPAAQSFQAQLALQQGRIAEAVRLVDQLPTPAVLPPCPCSMRRT